MRIGHIGVGNIGGTLAQHFVRVGHEVVLSNSRGPESLSELTAELGGRAQAATAADTARSCDVVVVSVPFGRYRELPSDGLAGKVVIDTNNYYRSATGTSSSSTGTRPRRASCCSSIYRLPAS